jgi:hypothetical protein
MIRLEEGESAQTSESPIINGKIEDSINGVDIFIFMECAIF